MPDFFQVVIDQIACDAMQRDIPDFLAFPGYLEMRPSASLMLEVPHPEFAQLITAKCVIKKRRQDSAIAQAFDGLLIGRYEQLASLVVAERRRFSFLGFNARTLHALDRIVLHGVLVAEILK